MNDLVGLDLGWRARKLGGIKPEDVPITARVADKLCEMDRFGQKTNRGFYIYPEGSRAGQPDPEVVSIVEETSAELGISRTEINDDEVLKRCLYPLINEGARIWKTASPFDHEVDIVYINGYGFRSYWWPNVLGRSARLDNILADIKRFGEAYGGPNWEPAPLRNVWSQRVRLLRACKAKREASQVANATDAGYLHNADPWHSSCIHQR